MTHPESKPYIPAQLSEKSGGRGLPPGMKLGKRITSFAELHVGDVIAHYSSQFDALNTIRVNGLRPAVPRAMEPSPDAPIELMDYQYAHGYLQPGGCAMWEHDLKHEDLYFLETIH
jgi:hypothetical protein